MGWHCLYAPRAVAWHVRRVTPERRNELPTEINWHSVKNRFLMRAKNISWRLYASCFFPTTLRDVQVIGYCLLVDRKLASALAAVWICRHDLKRKRQIIQAHRRVSDRELLFWFFVLSYIPGILLIIVIVNVFEHDVPEHIGMYFSGAWLAGFAGASFYRQNFRCPRCHQFFFRRYVLVDPDSRNCKHCNLARWTGDL